jgi:hypothetical protein
MSDYRVIGRWPRSIHKRRRGPLKSLAGLYGLASSGQLPNCQLFHALSGCRPVMLLPLGHAFVRLLEGRL